MGSFLIVSRIPLLIFPRLLKKHEHFLQAISTHDHNKSCAKIHPEQSQDMHHNQIPWHFCLDARNAWNSIFISFNQYGFSVLSRLIQIIESLDTPYVKLNPLIKKVFTFKRGYFIAKDLVSNNIQFNLIDRVIIIKIDIIFFILRAMFLPTKSISSVRSKYSCSFSSNASWIKFSILVRIVSRSVLVKVASATSLKSFVISTKDLSMHQTHMHQKS